MDDGAYADDKPLAKRWEEEEDEEDQLTEEYGMPHFVTLHQESAFPLGAGHLYKKLKAGEIDLDAEYQRGVTWSAPRQSGLIDSLERGIFVPPLIFHVKERPGQADVWTCIDGKQRMTSIEKFMDGQVPCRDSDNAEWYYRKTEVTKKRASIFPARARRDFRRKELVVQLYRNLSDAEERDIFRCVQEGVPLTTGEKIQAIGGPYGRLIEELRQRYFDGVRDDGSDGLDGRMLTCPRGKGSEIMAGMVHLVDDLIDGKEPTTYLPGMCLKEYTKKNTEGPVRVPLKSRLTQLLDRVMRLSMIPPTKRVTIKRSAAAKLAAEHLLPVHQAFLCPAAPPTSKSKSSPSTLIGTVVAPVEMIWLLYIIDACESRPDGELLEIIEIFKNDMRKQFPGEVKQNGKVVTWIKEWVEDTKDRPVGGKYMDQDDEEEEVALPTPKKGPAPPAPEASTSSRTIPYKRPRVDDRIDPRLSGRPPPSPTHVNGGVRQAIVSESPSTQPQSNGSSLGQIASTAPTSSQGAGTDAPKRRAFALPARLRAAQADAAPPVASMSPARVPAPSYRPVPAPTVFPPPIANGSGPPTDPRLRHLVANGVPNRAPPAPGPYPQSSLSSLPSFKRVVKSEEQPPSQSPLYPPPPPSALLPSSNAYSAYNYNPPTSSRY